VPFSYADTGADNMSKLVSSNVVIFMGIPDKLVETHF